MADMLNLSEVIVKSCIVGTEKGNLQYNVWQRKKIDELTELQDEKEKTIFDRLNKQKQTNTLFTRFRMIAEGGYK